MARSQIQPEENLRAVKAVPKAFSKNLVGQQCLILFIFHNAYPNSSRTAQTQKMFIQGIPWQSSG